MTSTALATRDLSRSFGRFVANDSVSLSIEAGARHALIGPNGAGKTTLLNLLTGELPPSSGEVFLGGERITTLPQHLRVRRGMTKTFQISALFSGLSVLESVMLATCQRRGHASVWYRSVRRMPAERRQAGELLERLGLDDEADTLSAHLPYGKQRLLELCLALATGPRVLLLDEPASGIPTAESREMFEAIAALPREVTILFIEHDMDLVFRFAERVSVLSSGRLLAEGTPEEIARDDRVREVYLGGRAE